MPERASLRQQAAGPHHVRRAARGRRGPGPGPVQIHVRQRPIENGDSCQVRSARGEGFLLP